MSSRLQLRLDSVSEIGLIGAGRLGTSLGCALAHAGARVVGVSSRSKESAHELAARLHSAADVLDAETLVARAPCVILSVPDDELATLVATLPWRAGQAVVYCSGALELSVLDAARARGALAGCLHPLQTFPERFAPPERFVGITCGIEADGALHAMLETIVSALGANVLALARKERALYHAAAVFASNYVVALHAAAEQAFVRAGFAPGLARPALVPLTEATVDNLRQLPIERALSGPLARGDAATIARQLEALRALPELRRLYVALAEQLLAAPLALSPEQRARLRAILV